MTEQEYLDQLVIKLNIDFAPHIFSNLNVDDQYKIVRDGVLSRYTVTLDMFKDIEKFHSVDVFSEIYHFLCQYVKFDITGIWPT